MDFRHTSAYSNRPLAGSAIAPVTMAFSLESCSPMHSLWSVKPLLPGSWKTLSESDACAFLARLSAAEVSCGYVPTACEVQFQRVRALPLAALPGWLLLEAECVMADGNTGYLPILYGPGGHFLHLDAGDHLLLEACASLPSLDCRVQNVAEYIRLVVALTPIKGHRHAVVEDTNEIDWPARTPRSMCASVATHLRGIRSYASEHHTLLVSASSISSGQIYHGHYRLHAGGQVHVEALTAVAPVSARHEEFHGPFRIVFDTPSPTHR